MTERLLYLSLIYYLIRLAPGVDCFQYPTGLEATLVNATLPIGLSYLSTQAVFDGKDSIYVIGGHNPNEKDHCTIFKYSISLDQIKCVANLPESSHGPGTANLGKNGKIYFSRRDTFDLYEFDAITNHFRGVEVPIVPRTRFIDNAVTNSGSLILMYSMRENTTVYEWYINATTYRMVGQLPFFKWGGSIHYLAESNKILIVESDTFEPMVLLDVETGQREILPSFLWYTYDRTNVIVNGELFSFGAVNLRTPNTFLWYDSAHHQAMDEIQNFPYNESLERYTGVYVQPLNRVYMFGGYIKSVGFVKDIWYVNMPPVADVPEIPTITDGKKADDHYDDFGCSQCGFCWGKVSFFFFCIMVICTTSVYLGMMLPRWIKRRGR